MGSIKLDFQNLRETRQFLSNKNLYNSVKNKDLVYFKKNINKNELDKVLNETNLSLEQLLDKCFQDDITNTILCGRISKKSSRQGNIDENIQIQVCSDISKNFDITIEKLKKDDYIPLKTSGEILSRKDIKNRNIQSTELLKSFDGKITGSIEGWIYSKIVYNSGGHQDNVFIETDNLCEWVKDYHYCENILFVMLIDTNLNKKIEILKNKYIDVKNILFVNHYEFQLYIIENYEKNKKIKLGQFYTKNYNYILNNFDIPADISTIVEPFAGEGDLLNFIKEKEKYTIECYDLDPKHEYILQRDSLDNPPLYDNKFILTNPPYLARNKNNNKYLYDKYDCNDLYKCFLITLINSECSGGIIIIPLNFISSIRKSDIELRKKFLTKFTIIKINIFEEKVFEDTSYSVCSFQFIKKIDLIENEIECFIYPHNKIIYINLSKNNNYTIGGEIYKLPKNSLYKIERATKLTTETGCITNIILKCLDDNINSKIRLEINEHEKIIDMTENLSFRSYATLVIIPKIHIEKQIELVNKFNEYLHNQREKYNSLFLSNYRESNSIARKRISFELAFQICSHLLTT